MDGSNVERYVGGGKKTSLRKQSFIPLLGNGLRLEHSDWATLNMIPRWMVKGASTRRSYAGYKCYIGNKKVDYLARKGSEANVHNIISSIYYSVDKITKAVAEDRWRRRGSS